MISIFLLIVIYIAFISLGLPDSMLGASWPMMYQDIGALLSQAGNISMISCAGTVISALSFAKIAKKFSTGIITSVSIAFTCVALFLFSKATSIWMIYPVALVLGIGGGCIDAALNNYVTLHYSTAAISFLHGFWGLGTTIGPLLLGVLIPLGYTWRTGYRSLSAIQAIIFLISLIALPLWKLNQSKGESGEEEETTIISYGEALKRKGSLFALFGFAGYCAFECTCMTWGATYMVSRGILESTAATYASFFFWGMTSGRMLTGFIADKLHDWRMIRIGEVLMLIGILIINFVPSGSLWLMFFFLGLGCAPLYPMMIHQTPRLYGKDAAAVLIGLQMATAYVGTTLAPPIFGSLITKLDLKIFPLYLALFYFLTVFSTEGKRKLLKDKNLL